jgi:diaminopimelate decarboxylase
MDSQSTGRFSHQQLQTYASEYGTPLYVYDGDRIAQKFHKLKQAYEAEYDRVKVFYALKANTNINIVNLLKQEGARAECISMGEMMLAHMLGYSGQEVLFTANSKSPQELDYAIAHDAVINLDSMGDLENLIAATERSDRKARVSFRINTDVDPNTHKHIATSHKTTKFGILFENDELVRAYRRALEAPLVEIWGIHSHIGSQIVENDSFIRNVALMAHAVKRLKQVLDIELKFINMGGGLGLPYRDGEQALEPEAVAKAACAALRESLADVGYTPELWLEPGRYFVGDAGFLLSRVNSVKLTPYRNFINVDTGFNHLLRPLLYDAYHRVRVLNPKGESRLFDVAGNICETGDILAFNRQLPTPEPGDLVAFLDSGAYGFSMASEFNMFHLPAELLVRGGEAKLIRTRGTMEDLLRNQVIPTGVDFRNT